MSSLYKNLNHTIWMNKTQVMIQTTGITPAQGTIPIHVRLEKFQFLEKGQNRNFGYKIVISVKISEIYSLDLG